VSDDAGVDVDVTTWYLEQSDPGQLRPGRAPDEAVEIVRAGVVSPEFNRFLYTAVGGDWHWLGRMGWTWQRWHDWLSRPGSETWVAWLRGTPAGYGLIRPSPAMHTDAANAGSAAGQVEITDFGLLPGFPGRGLGGHLLTEVLRRAWTLAERWPELPPTHRVWLHTCSLDSKPALPNYKARGLRVYHTEVTSEDVPPEPTGPWPGAHPPAADRA
jgi:GNAT superfamily N-acetyltransferase